MNKDARDPNAEKNAADWRALVDGDLTPPASWNAAPAHYAQGDLRLESENVSAEIKTLEDVGDIADLTLEKFQLLMPRMTQEALDSLLVYLQRIQSHAITGVVWTGEMAKIVVLIESKKSGKQSNWAYPRVR